MNSTVEKIAESCIAWLEKYLPGIIGAIIIIIAGIWLSGIIPRLIARTMKRAKIGDTVITFTQSFVKVSIKVIAVIAALGTAGFNIASIVTALGAATVAIGLALQDSLKNIASGIMLLINKPFQTGDFIEVGGLQGTVTRIDISNTHMLTIDNKEVILPNSNIAVSNIINFSSQRNRRVDLSFGIAYSDNIDKAKRVISEVIGKCCDVLDEPECLIAVGEHRESSVEIVVKVWCLNENYWNVYYFMQEQIKKAFDANGIEIPFQQIDIHNS